MSLVFFFLSLSLLLAFSDIFLLAVQLNAIQNLSELRLAIIIIIIRRGQRVPFLREKEKKKTLTKLGERKVAPELPEATLMVIVFFPLTNVPAGIANSYASP